MSYCWYYSQQDIENRTPSREDGVPLSVETRYRRDGARFIVTASNTLNLRYETPATGVVFFHRFFMIQSFKQFNRWVVAAACLLLAGKVEETPKKCRDILKVAQSILTEQQMANFGSNPKEELLTHERILLQTIKFDLQVQHPYFFLLKYAKSLRGDKRKTEELVQTAWTFVNDSLSTVLCLQWEPQAVAVAFLNLAGKLAKCDLQAITGSRSRSWWRQFVDTLDEHDLNTICREVLDTYGEIETGSNSQDEEDQDTPYETPHQTPPSTASIPPSMPVVSSTGVGHTTSSHLSLAATATASSSSASTVDHYQVLSQQSYQRPTISTLPLTLHNNPSDLLGVASVVSTNMTNLSYASTGSAVGGASSNTHQLQALQQHLQQGGVAAYAPVGASAGVGGAVRGIGGNLASSSLMQLQQLQQLQQLTGAYGHQSLSLQQQTSLVGGTLGRAVNLSSLQQQQQQSRLAGGLGPLNKPGGAVVGGGNIGAIPGGARPMSTGSSSLGLFGQQQQFHHNLTGRGSLSPHGMPGGPEGGALPPPAKRQAMDPYMQHYPVVARQQQQQQIPALPNQQLQMSSLPVQQQLPSVLSGGYASTGSSSSSSSSGTGRGSCSATPPRISVGRRALSLSSKLCEQQTG